MKSRKRRFSNWYNRTHGWVGTLWSERFKSTLVEGTEAALRITAAYIDPNPVWAEVQEDPKEYWWSGYGESMGGSAAARQRIASDYLYVLGPGVRIRLKGKEMVLKFTHRFSIQHGSTHFQSSSEREGNRRKRW